MLRLIGILFIFCLLFRNDHSYAQEPSKQNKTFIDSLRGSNGPGRQKWDVLHYDLTVEPNYIEKSISGINIMTFRDSGVKFMQLDLISPMKLDSVFLGKKKLQFKQDNRSAWIELNKFSKINPNKPLTQKLKIFFHGQPPVATNPPWDGGWVWKKDANNKPWISVACQGDGASIWFPCKDAQWDEPDNGCVLRIIVPDSLKGIGNGRWIQEKKLPGNRKLYSWQTKNTINTYNIIPYIGDYVHFGEMYKGIKGQLSLDYWVLASNLDKAKKQFEEVPRMLKAFESWMGPYPFYQDGYKLVEAPYLGMEHQSNIAYGNRYKNGYLGRDLSKSGQGLKWDFIIVHESGHEWFGNSVTAKDIADNWIHEGFTNYSETLFTEFHFGKQAAEEYVIGLQDNILNDKPMLAPYGVREEGSGDIYYKGANLLHTIRQVINNDSLFRKTLIGLNKTFYHRTVTTKEIEDYFIQKTGKKLQPIFDQYLRTTDVPELICEFGYQTLTYRWNHTVDGFNMPIKVKIDGNESIWLYPETTSKTIEVEGKEEHDIVQDKNFYYRLINASPRFPKDGSL